jgi:hypothetical protein
VTPTVADDGEVNDEGANKRVLPSFDDDADDDDGDDHAGVKPMGGNDGAPLKCIDDNVCDNDSMMAPPLLSLRLGDPCDPIDPVAVCVCVFDDRDVDDNCRSRSAASIADDDGGIPTRA